jgi:predicted transcriptional regulator
MTDEAKLSSVELAAELTIAWLGNQNVRAAAEDVPAFLQQMHATIEGLSTAQPKAASEPSATASDREFVPAVTVRKSLSSKDHIISMIDGKPYKTLRRHLSTHGLTPQEYRERYKLKPDYPMVAASYSEQRRAVAKRLGLGQKGRQAKAARAARPAAQPAGGSTTARRGRTRNQG